MKRRGRSDGWVMVDNDHDNFDGCWSCWTRFVPIVVLLGKCLSKVGCAGGAGQEEQLDSVTHLATAPRVEFCS